VRLKTYHHPVPLSRNLGTLTSWNPLGLSRPVMELLYLLPIFQAVNAILLTGNIIYTNSKYVNKWPRMEQYSALAKHTISLTQKRQTRRITV